MLFQLQTFPVLRELFRLINFKKNGILWNIVMAIGMAISKLFKLGDSMEVYAMKQGRLEDIK